MSIAMLDARRIRALLVCTSAFLSVPINAQDIDAHIHDVLSGAKECRTIDTPEVKRHIDRAYELIGRDLPQGLIPNLFIAPRMGGFCPPPPVPKAEIDNSVVAPIRAFDNLSYVGNRFVGAWVLKTSAGIILFDAMWTEKDAKTIIEPGIRTLGLDPADIKYLVITHGHIDHSGGAKHFQDSYGAKVLVGSPDIPLLAVPSAPGFPVVPAPTVDRPIKDGDVLTLGDTTVRLYVTPGHTPGSLAAIFSVADKGSRHVVTLFGGYGLPNSLTPDASRPQRHSGLTEYIAQIRRFRAIGRAAGADVAISTHPIFDDTVQKGAAVRSSNGTSPWVLGRKGWLRFADASLEVARAFEAMLHASDPE